MPIVIGIDEAGYGPMLGPLVVASAAFDVPGDDPQADLWKLLHKSVRCTKRGNKAHLFVADSKIVYDGGRGLCELERTILAFLAVRGKVHGTFRALLGDLCTETAALSRESWWRDIALPALNTAEQVEAAAAVCAAGQADAPFLGLAAEVVNPGPFNELMDRHRNKSVLLFQQNVMLIERAMAQHPGDLHFIIDKHGGRHYYAGLLANNFFGAPVCPLGESPQSSSYEVRLRGRVLRFTFAEKADRRHLPAALASMACKYVRELFMMGFNAYWCGRVDGLEPTAGYRNDCHRFITAIRPFIGPQNEREIIRERG